MDPGKYRDVSPDLKGRLFAFADRAECRELQVGPYLMQYLNLEPVESGERAQAGEPIVFFSGGAKLPVYSFAVIEALMQCNRVIALAQPPCATLDEYFDGTDAVLRDERIDRFHAAGSSWGGCVAQAATLRYRDRVQKTILSSTGLAGGKLVSFILRLHLASVRRGDPSKVVAAFRDRALGLLAGDDESGPFWRAVFDDLYDRHMTCEDYATLISTQLDYVARYAARVTREAWTKPVLILTTKDESAGSAGWRSALRRAYPAARFHIFETGGHHPALLNGEEYRRVVREFLRE